MTDANGYFRYDGLRPSRRPYSLFTSKSDYLWKSLQFNIDRPGHLDLGEIVLKKGKTVSGQVINSQGEPVSGTYVHAGPVPSLGHTQDTHTQTDEDGEYILRNVDWEEDGTAHIMVFAKGYGMAARKVEFGGVQMLDHTNFHLEEEAKIGGRLTDEEGNSLEGRKVEIFSLTFQGTRYSHLGGYYFVDETTKDGEFCIEGLPQGGKKVDLAIHDPNYIYPKHDASQSTIEAGMKDLHLIESKPPDAQIAGTVVNAETGQPIPQFRIRLAKYPKDESLSEKHPNNVWGRWWNSKMFDYVSSDGKFSIDYLEPNSKEHFLITAPGYIATEARPFKATRQQDASELIIRMQRGKTIHGVVTDSGSGQPIHCAVVTYFSPMQPCTHGKQILPQGISAMGFLPHPDLSHRLPQGGETVYAKESGEYEITTAQNNDNYLMVTAPGYSPAIVGPVEITEAVVSLPITLTREQNP